MTDLKKYLNSFYWYEMSNSELKSRIPDVVYPQEYPSIYQSTFGYVPVIYLNITDKYIAFNEFKKFEKFLISNGFDISERGSSTFKFINYEKCIVVSGDISKDYKQKDEDDDDDEYDLPSARLSSDDCIYISLLPTIENKHFIEKIIKGLSKYFNETSKEINRFYLIAQNNNGLFTQKTQFKAIPIRDDRYDIFYGEKFPHEKMKKFVTGKTENLMLLHGDPGTGKSNYIKHLITNCDKKVIYIPPSMLSVISSPGFVSFMMKNKDTILLIEDAEEVLSVDRNSATNNLLGLTDGFLKDALNLKIIATFNCNIGKIDPALLRKGRLYFEYKFDKLSEDECRKLADFLKINRTVTEPMTLAEFFITEENHLENSFEERKIGFL